MRGLIRNTAYMTLLFRRALTMGVRGLVEDERGGVLLVRHTYVKGWHFPGGGVEPRETALEALAREVEEETAVRLTSAPELVGVYLNRRLRSRDHVLLYRCREWQQVKTFKPNFEIAEARFFLPDELPEDLSRGTRRRLGELSGQAETSEDW